MILKPTTNEYPERFEAYIGLMCEDSLIDVLRKDRNQTYHFFENMEEHQLEHRYAQGKWSVKEILMHINYVERIMQHYAFAASRNDDQSTIAPINHNAYFENSEIKSMSVDELLDEFNTIRNYTIELFLGLSQNQLLSRCGLGNNAISARAIGFTITGHARHHINIIKERYL